MLRYETLILTVPEITQDEIADLEAAYEKAVKASQGALISFERWGKYRLAYPVRKNEYGVYFLSRFEAPQDDKGALPKQIDGLFTVKYPTVVMRSMTTALEPGQSLLYNKPESLEDAPASRDVDSFIRENKMEGLLPPKGRGAAQEVPEADLEVEEVDIEEDEIDEQEEA